MKNLDLNTYVKLLHVIYEDNHIIVVVKPVDILSQADNTNDIDMLTIIKAYLKQKYQKKGNVYLGLIHRLDRMAGGIMVFAKTSKAASRLSKCISDKKFIKEYIAVVNGIFEQKEGQLKDYLKKDCKNNKTVVVNKDIKDTKLALLDYSVQKNFVYNNKQYSLVKINLHTGRHHQIRIQFANISHPLYGDVKYDENAVNKPIALWAYHLMFEHPVTHQMLNFEIMPNQIEDNLIYKKNKIWDVIN